MTDIAQAEPALLDIERFEQAKDGRLWRFLDRSIRFLNGSGLRWAAFGSCSVFAHRGIVRRLTRDLDIFLPREDFERLEAVAQGAGLDAARERDSFVRIRDDIYQIHAVPDTYTIFDYRSGEVLAPLHAPVDWDGVAVRPLHFSTPLPPLDLRVAPAETVACICMMRPLNVNSIDDITGLLTRPAAEPRGIRRFVEANPPVAALVQAQLERLARTSTATPDLQQTVQDLLVELRPCPD